MSKKPNPNIQPPAYEQLTEGYDPNDCLVKIDGKQYRIKQVGDKFYAQTKFMWWWVTCGFDHVFKTYEAAVEFLDEEAKKNDKTTKYHPYPPTSR